jgi:hypothetical protein
MDGGTARGTTALASGDGFVHNDAGTMRMTTIDKISDFMAGDGLAVSSGVLAVGVDDSTIELDSDVVRIKDNGVTLAKMAGLARGKIIYGDASGNPAALAAGSANFALLSDGTDLSWGSLATDGIADNAVTLAKMAGIARGKIIVGDASGNPSVLNAGGNGKILVADANGDPSWTTMGGDATLSAGALTIAAGAVDNAMLAGSIADSNLLALSTANKVSLTALDLDGGTDIGAALVDADLMIVDDGAGGTNRKATMHRLKTYMADMAGHALTADSATFTGKVKFEGDVHLSGALTTVDSVNTVFYDGILGLGYQSGSNDLVKGDRGFVFGLDAENDTAMIWDESASEFAFITTTQGPGDVAIDGNMTVTSYANLKVGVLTATAVAVQVNVISKDDSEINNGGAGYALASGDVLILEEDLGANRKVILPAVPAVGDSVEIKLKGIGAAGRALYVETDGGTTHTVDGGQSIILESPYAAVKLVYAAANDWRVF